MTGLRREPVPLVQVLRGGLVESTHRGHLVACRANGDVVAALGDPEFGTYLRSAAKPLQAIPVVESGAAERYQLEAAELALMCGSVSGQEFHVAAARSILGKIGMDEVCLECGIHRPSHRPTARRLADAGEPYLPIHNNCVGKHAAMLVLCAHRGWDPTGYIAVDHPVQVLIRQVVAEMCELPPAQLGIGIDGCGVPVFRAPLVRLARAYARLAAPGADPSLADLRVRAIRRLTSACIAHPEMVAGDQRVCTETMRAGKSSFLAKTGAEGSYGIALLERGLGIAFKIEDGAARAIDPVAVEVLYQAGVLAEVDLGGLRQFHRTPLRNHRKEIVGELRPVLDLEGALAP